MGGRPPPLTARHGTAGRSHTVFDRMGDDGTTTACPVCGTAALPDAKLGGCDLARCPRCRFMFLLRAAGSAAALYDDGYFAAYAGGDYRDSEAQRRHESRLRLDWIARWAPPPARLLEIGAAAGYFLDEARERGYATAGVEVSPSMAAHARDALGLDVAADRVETASLPERAYDLVCAWHVVEHLPEPVRAVERLRAALAPGGHLAIEVPNAASALARRMGASWPALDLPHHVGHHGPRSLRTLLERAGLRVVALDTLPFGSYDRRGPAVRAARAGLDSVRARKPLPPGPHPTEHELLRAVAERVA